VVLGSSITTHTAAEVLASASSSLRRLPSDYTSTLVALRTVRPLCSARRHSVTPQAAFELVRRRVEEELPARPLLASPDAVAHFMAPRLSDLPAEEFHTLTLNTHHFLARDITITRGLLDSAPIDPRAAFRQALAERAGNVVFVHTIRAIPRHQLKIAPSRRSSSPPATSSASPSAITDYWPRPLCHLRPGRPSRRNRDHACLYGYCGIYLVYTNQAIPVSPRHQRPAKQRQRPRPQPAPEVEGAAQPTRARLFTNGRSQAVRLPKAFRFPGSEVLIRHGEGNTVVLEAVPGSAWPEGYWNSLDALADDLALGRVPPLGARLLDLDPEDV
jgi:DNA repair protein RadC/virulence-associated protein VagC